ncbi:ras guanine nucleotide exchange factor domain-containing protein [Dichotomocladium elegans]|nr:ras guanine nucleotide exchange factor domain-containing protein [Dichotomocladium elegans]
MVSGKRRIVAGTAERLFLRLADEGSQDLDYVDTYIMNHPSFTTSPELFENLAARFHLEVRTDQIIHVKRCIQVKVLNIIVRWIKIQYQDFKNNHALQRRLENFIHDDILHAGFEAEATVIKEAMDTQMALHHRRRHSLVALTCHSLCSPSPTRTSPVAAVDTATPSASQTGSPPLRRQQQSMSSSSPPYSPSSMLSSFLSSTTNSTPPASPTCLHFNSPPSQTQSILFAIDAKHIARYLTLADFYILKCITTYDYLHGQWRQRETRSITDEPCYITMMTKRANTLTHWVIHELVSLKGPKQRRAGFRHILDIAKLCLEWNNFHTAMVLTMGLVTSPVQKLHDMWDGLPKAELNMFMALQKYLDLGNNMAHYRQAFQKRTAKRPSPSIPFFPLVLKDITFYMDGIATVLPPPSSSPSSSSSTVPLPPHQEPLINFGKFYDLTKFVNLVLSCTRETYRFANELDHLAFFSPTGTGNSSSMDPSFLSAGPLDPMADVIEHKLRRVAGCLSNSPSHCELFSGTTTIV